MEVFSSPVICLAPLLAHGQFVQVVMIVLRTFRTLVNAPVVLLVLVADMICHALLVISHKEHCGQAQPMFSLLAIGHDNAFLVCQLACWYDMSASPQPLGHGILLVPFSRGTSPNVVGRLSLTQ